MQKCKIFTFTSKNIRGPGKRSRKKEQRKWGENHWNKRWFPRLEGCELMSCQTAVIHHVVRTSGENKPTPRCISVVLQDTGGQMKLPYASVFSGEKATYTESRIRIGSLRTAAPEVRWCSWTFKILKENDFQRRVLFLIKLTVKSEDDKDIFPDVRKWAFKVLLLKQLKGVLQQNEKRNCSRGRQRLREIGILTWEGGSHEGNRQDGGSRQDGHPKVSGVLGVSPQQQW